MGDITPISYNTGKTTYAPNIALGLRRFKVYPKLVNAVMHAKTFKDLDTAIDVRNKSRGAYNKIMSVNPLSSLIPAIRRDRQGKHEIGPTYGTDDWQVMRSKLLQLMSLPARLLDVLRSVEKHSQDSSHNFSLQQK